MHIGGTWAFISTATWRCRKPFSQWECSFRLKAALYSWVQGLRPIVVTIRTQIEALSCREIDFNRATTYPDISAICLIIIEAMRAVRQQAITWTKLDQVFDKI